MAAAAFPLIASGATAERAGDDGAREVPHLQLPGAPPRLEHLMDIMSTSGCGRFAALVAATPNVSDVFQQRLVAGGGGLTLFCPDDKAVDAFEPKFRALADSVRVNILLHHGAAARYDRAQLAGFDWVAVPTLATNETTMQTVLVRDRGDTMTLWPTWPRDGVATVTKTVSSEEPPLVLYVVDAVLLRQKLDGAGEAAPRGGYFAWLHCCIPVWAVLLFIVTTVVSAIAGYLAGWYSADYEIRRTMQEMRIMH